MKTLSYIPAHVQMARTLEASPSAKGWYVGLYAEHLEEASFLYEQRRDVLLDDPELTWLDLADFEERLEAHLDALVLGKDLALAVCRQQVEEGDAGELHAAVRVFCRQQRKDLLDGVFDGLEADDEERVCAMSDALGAELPEAWADDLVQMLADEASWRQRVAAHVVGYRRLDAGQALLNILPQAAPDMLTELVWALGRLRVVAARTVLYNEYLRHDDEAVRAAAALALLRLGEQAAPHHLISQERNAPWAQPLIAISGGAAQQRDLLATAMPESVMALGLLGDGGAIEVLLGHLAEPSLAEAAALGLYLITGFAPVEEAFVPEEIDEDELFEDELDAYRRGELPLRPDGKPYGETVERLAQDPAVWQAWWDEHGGRFQLGVRYRLGEPCTPMSLVRTLQAERMPRPLRQLAYEELVIRYDIDIPFEADRLVVEQRRAIADLERQAAQREADFRPGRWYFAGRLPSK